jgi:hypothetical protein
VENIANSKAADRIERPMWDRPKPKGLKVKTNIKAGPHALLATGGD